MKKKWLLAIPIVFISQVVLAINFGGTGARLGKELEKINPFSSSPESRANDFYKNAESKVFDCKHRNSWLTLVDGHMTVNGRVVGQVKKLSVDRQLLIRFDTADVGLVCNVVAEDWYSGDVQELTPCKINENPVLLCKRKYKN